MRLRSPLRPAASLVEMAFIGPVVFLLLIGLVVGGLGIFRYQQIACLSREAARYASVRGARYQQTTGLPAATPTDIYQNVIQPKAVALDMSQLTYSVTWNPDNNQNSLVTVKINYKWVPEAFLGGINLGSTSTMMISY